MTNLINSQMEALDEYSIIMTNLRNPRIQDKTHFENMISDRLDEFVMQHGEELLSLPVQSLVRILSNPNRVFTQHDHMYDLILSRSQNSNDSNIFTLLSYLELSKLSPRNIRNAVEHQQERYGMLPNPDIFSMVNQIDELKKENHRLKENGKKIGQIFIKSQKLNFKISKYADEENILNACERGDVEKFVSLFEIKFIEDEFFSYSLKFDLTADIRAKHIRILADDITIPKSVEFEGNEFFITKIDRLTFQYSRLKNIIFPEDSKVSFIDEEAFHYTLFQTIKLPPLIDFSFVSFFDPDAFHDHVRKPLNFESIILWPSSVNFSIFNGQLLLAKSEQNSDVFNVLVAVKSDVQVVDIPDYVTDISKYAFSGCHSLTTVNFSESSRLKTINTKLFYGTSIDSITIPSHVVQIDSSAFFGCNHLETVDFAPNSEIRIFNDGMFTFCSVQNLTIPSNVEELKVGCFDGISKSCNISISPNNHNFALLDGKLLIGKSDINSENFDVLIYAREDIEEANIPNYIKRIRSGAFNKCMNLRTVHFDENSQLSIIEELAFNDSALETITIPSHVVQIDSSAFYGCKHLETVDFAPNSEIRIFNDDMFLGSSIQNLTIPSNVEELKVGWFNGISKSCNISISPNNHNFALLDGKLLIGKSDINSENFDVLIYAREEIEEANIPNYIKKIRSGAFNRCMNLKTVHFDENSQLSKIGKFSFYMSSLTDITIPKNVKSISTKAFSKCMSLLHIEFQPNSELQNIGSFAFSESSLRDIVIPQHVTKICENAFYRCKNLRSVGFAPNSELEVIESSAFMCSSLPSILIPSSVTTIETNAFADCGLSTIVFPEDSQISDVSSNAFYSNSIKKATIPSRLANIIHI